jgi:DtxR family Mn-dependent transcriptional regulator
MYLRTIYELVEEGIPPLRARIAERLKQSGPTVSETVARMERDGLLTLNRDRQLSLTPKGELLAARVMRRHRLAECLLTDVIGLEWNLVHDEACRWEHVISTDVERRLVKILNQPTHSPYGNPIPALQELESAPTEDEFLAGVVQLSEILADAAEQQVVLLRMGESIQTELAVLAALDTAGVRPGETITVSSNVRSLRLVTANGRCDLPVELAEHLFVKAE